MSITYEALGTALTLGEVSTLIQSEPWRVYLSGLAKRQSAATSSPDPTLEGELAALRASVERAKARLSPEHNHQVLQKLKSLVYDNPTADPERLRPLLVQISSIRAALPLREHERVFGQLETAVGQMFAASNTGTGYSNRARRAKDLFTEHAGRTRIEGAATDRHGNAAGTGYDLGRDGAFEGHSVHVLHFYTGEGFDFSKPGEAFRRKGFAVERLTEPGTPHQLKKWLSEAHQLWLISTSSAKLDKDHIEVIREFWQRGGALYLWGDNDPYYVDANAVLKALFGKDVQMKGNTHGGQVVREIEGGKGFLPHLVTTGLVHLYEGITVASFDIAAIGRHQFAPLLYGSAGNLITIVREPSPAAGAVMADTAFTRLFVQWDDAGSARYVCNAACFLAAMTLPEEEPEGDTSAEPPLEYDPRDAFVGKCSLTDEKPSTWLVLSVAEMADALRNTNDMVLTDPFCAGSWNRIFSDAVYSEQMGRWILNQPEGQRIDPFTRKPVVDCLPLVDLSSEHNLRTFTQALCRCLMGGKYLPTPARLLFFAVVDQMIEDPQTKNPEVWQFLYRQCLAHFPSTPEFTEIGRRVPLLDAMTALFSAATPEMVQIRRSFASVGVIGRTLLREGRATRDAVWKTARRSLISSIVRDAILTEKDRPGHVATELSDLLYKNFHGVATLGGGRLVHSPPSFVADRWSTEQRLEHALGGRPLLEADDYTAVLHALLPYDLRQFSLEAAVERISADSSTFRDMFAGKPAGDTVSLLNQRFAPYLDPKRPIDGHDPHVAKVPPFATTLGPSVYRCVCGASFGDPSAPLTPETLLALRTARTNHFREVYRVESPGETWYPSRGTLHYNLHRAVQQVVKEGFPEALEIDESMVIAVAAYLQRDDKGYICDPGLEGDIRETLGSYLALRRAGQPHPEGVLTLELKAAREREALGHREA